MPSRTLSASLRRGSGPKRPRTCRLRPFARRMYARYGGGATRREGGSDVRASEIDNLSLGATSVAPCVGRDAPRDDGRGRTRPRERAVLRFPISTVGSATLNTEFTQELLQRWNES